MYEVRIGISSSSYVKGNQETDVRFDADEETVKRLIAIIKENITEWE